MACIRVISSTTIKAPSQVTGDITQKIQVTPWDLESLKLEMNQKGLLFHKPKNANDTSNQLIIQHLKHSLSTTLAFFPPFAGRLIITEHEDNTASCSIACNNVGALFVHATAKNSTSVADILQPNYVPSIVDSFFPLNGVRNYEGTSQPLLAVQVTELVDGIFVGCTINHVVADGKSFWHFINSWAEISHGNCHDETSKLLIIPPALARWFPDGIDCPIPIRFPFTKEDKKQYCENSDPQFPTVRRRIFHFTKDKIADLKSKANAEASSDKISSLQALLAHLWRAVIRCQRTEIDPHEEISYCLAIDLRRRMVPPLPENYFGNALRVGVVTMKAREILEGGIGKVALEMNKMIASQSDERIKSHYESLMKSPILFQPGCGLSSSIKTLATGSSPRFNVNGNDFGWGKPVAVRSGSSNKSNGMTTVFSGVEEGSVDIEVCLFYDILEAIGNDPHFIHVF